LKQVSVYIRLGAMMFLQYAIWGAWAPVLWTYLVGDPSKGVGLGFSDFQASWVMAALTLACILAPFTGGQIADRWVPSQFFLAVAHALGAVVLFVLAGAQQFVPFIGLMAVYALLYAPTLAVTNSLAFRHIGDREKQFGIVRVFGTVGWIVAGWILTYGRGQHLTPQGQSDSLLLAGAASVVMAVLCLALPSTPPKREGSNPLAFVEGFRMLADKRFLLFMVIAFVVTTELQFYYLPTSEFLEKQILIPAADVPMVMTTAQIAEVVAMALLLPLLLPKIGIRWALAIGVIAWPLRYVAFAFGTPELKSLVVGSLALHGLGYTFFFVVSQIYVDKVSPPDIRASAQSLLTLVTLGFGNFLGTQFTGWIMNHFREKDPLTGLALVGGAVDWTSVFLIPCALTVLCALAFLVLFRDPRANPTPKTAEATEAAA